MVANGSTIQKSRIQKNRIQKSRPIWEQILRAKVTVYVLLCAFQLGVCRTMAASAADPSTLTGKVVCGYQGWFLHPGDTGNVGWRHWSHDRTVCNAATVNFDLWPDMSEYTETEATDLHYANGQRARLFSSLQQSTTFKHFEWMQNYHVDGAFLQRFLGELKDGRFLIIRDTVTRNVMAAAERYGRTFSIMWDISGVVESTLVQDLETDWNHLVQDLHVDRSSAYQKHGGKLVVTIWGFGLTDRPGSAQQAIEVVRWLQVGLQSPI